MTKKMVNLSGIAIITITIIFIAFMIAKDIEYRRPRVPGDQTNNINVMLERIEGWEKIDGIEAVIDKEDLDMIDGSTATIPITAEILRQFFDYTDEQVKSSYVIHHSTTHNAYVNLAHERSNTGIIFVTPPSEDELKLQDEHGVRFHLERVATDGFVFITNIDNPVDSLTVKQIQDIYSGKITNWKEVGGKDLEIVAYQRERNSGSQTAMEENVMQGIQMIEPIETRVIGWMGGLIDAVAEYSNSEASIGYTYNYYLNNLYKSDKVKVIKVDGVSATNENLLNKTYPFYTPYYAVIRESEELNSPARKLQEFLISPKGQELIEMAGYCRRQEE